MNGRFILLVALVAHFTTPCIADTVVIRSGNVIGPPETGEMAHHILQTQQDFAKLVSVETNGEVELRILEGKRAARAAEKLSFINEEATAIHHAALNEALGVTIHRQTDNERQAWRMEFSGKVRDGILARSDDPAQLQAYIDMLDTLADGS